METKIKVVIADDEQMVCVVEENLIAWDELNLELSGIAHDGAQLLALILEKKPDIVITDICMPELSGLELIKQVRQQELSVKFIIISGYKQFEFAHDALKYRVDDYLLKPINGQELNDALLKLRMEILNERAEPGANIRDKVESLQDKETIRRIFLNQLVHNQNGLNLDASEIERNYGVNFREGLFQAVVTKIDGIADMPEKSEGLVSLSSKIVRVFNKIFEPHCYEILSAFEDAKILMAINYPESAARQVSDGIDEYFLYAKNIADLFEGVSLTVGTGNQYPEMGLIRQSFIEAETAVYQRIILGTNRVIQQTNLTKPAQHPDDKALKELRERLGREFEALNASAITETLNELFQAFLENCDVSALTAFLYELTDDFFLLHKSLGNEIPNRDYIQNRILRGIDNATSLPLLQQHVDKELTELTNRILEEKVAQSKKPIREAIRFIEANYNKPISLGDVAEAVWLNPVYFSNLFKKETGENYIDYVHKYRINIAKEKLRTTNNTINQICYAVGYDDPNYFVKLFKKYVGLTPSEFRKIYG